MALRGDARIKPGTAERVREAATCLGYDPVAHHAARRLRAGGLDRVPETHVVGLLAWRRWIETEYFRRLAQGVLNELADSGYGALVVSPPTADLQPIPPSGRSYLDILARGEIDGLIALSGWAGLQVMRHLRQRIGFGQRPSVTLMSTGGGYSCVRADDVAGMAEAVRALLDRGHRHLLRVGCNICPEEGAATGTPGRRQAIEITLRAVGLDPHCGYREYVVPTMSWLDPAMARLRLAATANDVHELAFVEHLGRHPEVTAILADNDAIAIHACAALERAGQRIPEDFSVVGFDDTDPLPGAAGGNRLSSVALPLEEVGVEGVRLLLELIRGEIAPAAERLLPARFVCRASVGPARDRG